MTHVPLPPRFLAPGADVPVTIGMSAQCGPATAEHLASELEDAARALGLRNVDVVVSVAGGMTLAFSPGLAVRVGDDVFGLLRERGLLPPESASPPTGEPSND